ncbi:MAG: 3-coathanger stack domain-containing protein [bacterium]
MTRDYVQKKITGPLILILLLAFIRLSGQEIAPADLYLNSNTDNFSEIVRTMNNYFEGKSQGQGTGYKQWKRWEYFNKSRLTPDGKITNRVAGNLKALQEYEATHQSANSDNTTVSYGNWTSLGPTGFVDGAGWNGGIGRISCIAFHPSNASIFWVGTPSGGLWKTTSGGSSWTPLTDGMPSIGVSSIAVDYSNTSVIYILTGDGDAGDTQSIGVLKTTNSGETWLSTGLSWLTSASNRGYKLLIHPTSHLTLFCVSTAGIYKTINGGGAWTLVQSGSFQDIEFKPGDPAIMYASSGTFFYRSGDSGDSWFPMISGVPTSATRMAIGVSPANPAYVYLLTGPATDTGVFKGVYRSNDSGLSFVLKANTPNILGGAVNGQDDKHQTSYDLAIAVDGTNVGTLIIGGINTWKSLNFGATSSWVIKSMWNSNVGGIGYTHADIHALEINPLNSYLYCCSDGGVYRSVDFGENWTDLTTGIANTAFYRIAGFEANSNLILGGAQDNGSNLWNGGTNMLHVLGADGMDCMIDFNSSSTMYYSSQNGTLVKSTNSGASYTDITPSGITADWLSPYIMDPNNHLIIYAGYSDVYKSTNGGSSWTNMGADGRGAMAIGTTNSQRVYASNGSILYKSDNGGTSWTNISSGLPGIEITFISVDPHNSLNIYVTLGGLTDGEKVYHNSNVGTAGWTNISGTLPNVAANCIAFEDNNGTPAGAIYVGTDIGIFYLDNSLSDWLPFRNGLPTVPVMDIEINSTNNLIFAGTFGRGLWVSATYTSCPLTNILTQGNDPGNPNYTGYQFYEVSGTIYSSRIITGGLGTDVTYKAGSSITLTTGFNARKDNLFKAVIGSCQAMDNSFSKPVRLSGTYGGKLPE